MIMSFKDKRTESFAQGRRVKAFEGFGYRAEMRLDQLDSATSLLDLDLPRNRLEALKGALRGQYSIRINDQWRICFEWPKGTPGPINVQIIDYH
jgi:proteic killer suppression protein